MAELKGHLKILRTFGVKILLGARLTELLHWEKYESTLIVPDKLIINKIRFGVCEL